jgi:carbamoyltransferase
MSTSILGISAYYHDSAAALVIDGRIVAAAQEERFTRRKHDPAFPRGAIGYCQSEAGITVEDLDYVVFYERPDIRFERLLETHLACAPVGFESFRLALPSWAQVKLHLPETICSELGPAFKGQILFAGHHEAHAASAFFPSPFPEAAILTLDAVGEWATSSLGTGRGNEISMHSEMKFPHSLGLLYSAFTYYTGFKVNSGEYKLMGLAPYGRPVYADTIMEKVATVMEDGSLWLDMSYFNYQKGMTMTSDKFHDLFGGPPRKPEGFITQREMDLGASIQAVCEEVVLRAAAHASKVTGMRNLVMAGGVALNCVANGRLRREGPFEKIWIQPAAGDAGGALGAALLAWHATLGQPRYPQPEDSQQGSLLGPAFGNDDIGVFLDSVGAAYQYYPDEGELLDQVAALMSEEKVVGWFQGRMEYGPRSLGCRSIIGDARSSQMQQTMNLKIKYRESFRPFAPCVLRECVGEIFDMTEEEENPYMLQVASVKQEWRTPLTEDDERRLQDPDLRVRVSVARSQLPAITHVDYSARVQTVDAGRHGRFHRLMRRFRDVTGCPVIVNTSFNIRGEPIVRTPEEAHRCFLATEMDCLVLENYVLLKADQPAHAQLDAELYKASYALD